ncbi:MAG: PilT/PilU family type 4a pilus ATPase [Rivihabitans pingtungensis]
MEIPDLLAFARSQHASDLHLSAGLPPLLRVHGDICPIALPALSAAEVRALLHSMMDEGQRRQYAEAHECDFALAWPDSGRCRVNVFSQQRGPAAAIRLIPEHAPALEHLGAPPAVCALDRLPHGLVLVTGATGSGKSTTLAALLARINARRAAHILTIEDPIEFIHPCQLSVVHQREVGRHTHGFATALRAALREDPDVILLGEMRDADTMRLALTAAETGHLVLATLHTQSAAQAPDRVINSLPAAERDMARAVLADCLRRGGADADQDRRWRRAGKRRLSCCWPCPGRASPARG